MEMLRPRPAYCLWVSRIVVSRCVLLALLALTFSACTATRVRVSEGTPLGRFLELSKPFHNRVYRVAIGDTLGTRCYFNPQLDEEVLVRPDGNISLSLIGEIKAVGRTAQELSAEITKAYSAYFLKSTAVVIVRTFNGHRVFTSGELKLPGMFNLMTSARTVLESIAASGGATPEATLHKVVLMRRLPNQSQPMIAQLDVAQALSGEDPSQDVQLMPGDYVYVPRAGMAELNLVMHQYLLNNFNMTTYAGVPVQIKGISK